MLENENPSPESNKASGQRPGTPMQLLRKYRPGRKSDTQLDAKDSDNASPSTRDGSKQANNDSPGAVQFVNGQPVPPPPYSHPVARTSLPTNDGEKSSFENRSKRSPSIDSLYIRPATRADGHAIANIMSHYIQFSCMSMAFNEDSVEYTTSRIKSLNEIGLPSIVATTDTGIVGFARANPRCPWGRFEAGYNHTADVKIFVDHKYTRQRVGTALLARAEVMKSPDTYTEYTEGWHPRYKYRSLLVEVIMDDQRDGAQLEWFFLHFGFDKIGTLKTVGWKQNRWFDVSVMQLNLW